MTAQKTQNHRPTHSISQQLTYAFIGFVIWVIGVIIVRLLGPDFFEENSALLVLLFAGSIPFGFVIQFIAPLLSRQPMKDTLTPVIIMVGTALMCDGIAIAFSDVYSADTAIKMSVGGWLLWTFGTQLIITHIIVARANSD